MTLTAWPRASPKYPRTRQRVRLSELAVNKLVREMKMYRMQMPWVCVKRMRK